MPHKQNIVLALIAVLLLLSSAPLLAQSATGIPPFSSFGGGRFDAVNLGNLNVHLDIPILTKAGRGIPFSYALSYDSLVWTPVGVSGSQTWQPAANWGWRDITEASLGYLSYVRIRSGTCPGDGTIRFYWQNWAYHDSTGAIHQLPNLIFDNCTLDEGNYGDTANDGSGFTAVIYNDTAAPSVVGVYPRSGGSFIPPLQQTTGSGTLTDRNGNQVSTTGTVFTDTLGQTALTIDSSNSMAVKYKWTNPQNGTSYATVNYSSFSILTNFQCSGVSQYSGSANLVSSIALPDGSSYQFSYEKNGAYYTGRLASVTLPTGGQIQYTYTGSHSGFVCADGTIAGLTRQTPDGTWTYARVQGTGAAWTTTVSDPMSPSNQTVINFQGGFEVERKVYQGSSAGTPLVTTDTCYNGAGVPCTGAAVSVPISKTTVVTTVPKSSGTLQSQVVTFLNTYGLPTEVDEYDYGLNAPGVLLRKTITQYASLGNYIADKPAWVKIEDGSSTVKAQTTYTYDETTPTPTTNTPQHVSVSGSRGNLTTASRLVQGSTFLTSHATYNDTGTTSTTTDVNQQVTTFYYDNTGNPSHSCGNSFVTQSSVTVGTVTLQNFWTWNCIGAVETSTTDPNGQVTSYAYSDPNYWRRTTVTEPIVNASDSATNTTSLSYFAYAGPSSPAATDFYSLFPPSINTSIIDARTTFDSLGRPHVSQQQQGPNATTYDSVETDYDAVGRPSRVTIPYVGTAGQTNSTIAATTTLYDALNRPTTMTDSGGGTVTFSYSANDVLKTLSAPSGENTKVRQFEYDGLGRLTSVCEVTSAIGSASCGQNTALLTPRTTAYVTQYTYDLLDNITGVTQSGQMRSFSYDSLGRITSESNPETGTISYTYDTDSTCGTYTGDLVKRVDAVGNLTCYVYDGLHRVVSVTYPSGSYSAVTPSRGFVYDSAIYNGQSMANAKGRLAEAYTGPSSAKLTDLFFSYSPRGQVSDTYESTPHSGGYYHLSELYWANTQVQSLNGLSGLPTFSIPSSGLDGEGRATVLNASSGQNPVTGVTYNNGSDPTEPLGALTSVNFGSGDSDSLKFDPNTSRMTQYTFTVNGQSTIGKLTWNDNDTLGTFAVTADPFDSGNVQSCSYVHDDVDRIASANCGCSTFDQTFGYDSLGNILNKTVPQGCTGISFQPVYSPSNSYHFQTISSFPVSYDANGNLLADGSHTYTWDAEGRPVSIDGVALTHDALLRIVEQNRSGTYTQLVYAPAGGKLALMNGQALQAAFVSLPGGGTAVYGSGGLLRYRQSDWLGSSRLASTASRTVYSESAYGVYGEAYAQYGTADLSFTGQNQDTVTGLYDFMFREYHPVQGRWISPDPAGLRAVDPTNPQSWNRYAYNLNSPLNTVDPLGLACQWQNGEFVCHGGSDPLGGLFGWTDLQLQDLVFSMMDKQFSILSGDNLGEEGLGLMVSGFSQGVVLSSTKSPSPCSAMSLQNYNRIGNDGLTIRQHIESQHMNEINNQPPSRDPITGKPNGQYMLDYKGTPDQNFAIIMMLNTVTIAAANTDGTWRQDKGSFVFEHTFSPAELFLIGPGRTESPNVLGKARVGPLFGITLMLPTARNKVVLNSSCQVVTSFPIW